MASLYGKHWLDMWADVPVEAVKNEWANGIERFKLPEIGKAIEHCAAHCKFPPTLPEFIQLCKANTPSEIHKALPRHLTDEELAANQRRIQEEVAKLAANPPRDYKQWARNILRDVKAGIKCNDVAVRFAHEALAGEV